MVVGQLAKAGFITELETSRAGSARSAPSTPSPSWPAPSCTTGSRAGRAAAARVPGLRRRTVADRGAATGRGCDAAAPSAGPAGRQRSRDPRARSTQARCAACTGCSWSRRSTGSRCSTPSQRSSSGSSTRSATRKPAGARCGPNSTASPQHRRHRRKETVMTTHPHRPDHRRRDRRTGHRDGIAARPGSTRSSTRPTRPAPTASGRSSPWPPTGSTRSAFWARRARAGRGVPHPGDHAAQRDRQEPRRDPHRRVAARRHGQPHHQAR